MRIASNLLGFIVLLMTGCGALVDDALVDDALVDATMSPRVSDMMTRPYLVGEIGSKNFDGEASLDLEVFDGAILSLRVLRAVGGLSGFFVMDGETDLARLSLGEHVFPIEDSSIIIVVCYDAVGEPRYDQIVDTTTVIVSESDQDEGALHFDITTEAIDQIDLNHAVDVLHMTFDVPNEARHN